MTPKQKKFVAEYLVDQNATRSARDAGYKGTPHSLEVTGSRLLRNAEVRAAIDAGLAKQTAKIEARVEVKVEKLALTKEKWLERIEAIAFSDIGDAFTLENGKLTMKIEDMKRSGFSKQIRKIRVMPGGKVEVDLHPVLPAIELLGRSQGWVKDQVEHSGSIAQPVTMDPKERAELLKSPEAVAMVRGLLKKIRTTGTETPGEGEAK